MGTWWTTTQTYITTYPWMVGTTVILAVFYLGVWIGSKGLARLVEGFQGNTDTTAPLSPPPMPLPIGIGFTKEHCGMIKGVHDIYVTQLNKHDEASGITRAHAQRVIDMYKELMDRFDCTTYLAKVEAGEIPMPKSTPDDMETTETAVKRLVPYAS